MSRGARRAAIAALGVLGALGLVCTPPASRAAPAAAPPPALCKGCLFVPAKGEHRPLLVLLHGDRQPPRRMIAAFRAAAARYDVALLAPPCPEDDGCDRRSFWRWNADPGWLAALVDRAVAERSIDPDHVALAGWSGGATYLGKRMHELGDRYSAAVLAGGGMPAPHCADAGARLPVLLIQGDRNPMHHLTVALREHLLACEHEVSWELLREADHGAEWKAITRSSMQRKIFEFLDAHPRRAAVTSPTSVEKLPDQPAR